VKNRKGLIAAQKLMSELGFADITDINIEEIASYLGCTLIEEPLDSSDGKIIRGSSSVTIIKVDSKIQHLARRRFTIAHEIGHFILHKKLDVHSDNSNTLNWFKDLENQAKRGVQEFEANDFASELLMPSEYFIEDARTNCFSPEHLQWLADRYKTSLTSTAFRLLHLNVFPIYISMLSNGIIKYSKKSESFKVWYKDNRRLPPPEQSVAQEYINSDYEFIYTRDEKGQEINKSVWFELYKDEPDSPYIEYCIPTKRYKTIISIVWKKEV
jgi:hypothetical protein